MRVIFPPSTLCTTTGLELDLEPARDTASGEAGAGEHVVALGDQLEHLVANVLEHALEAREVATRALVPAIGVRLGRHSGGMTITMSSSITSSAASTPPLAYCSNSRRTTSTLASLIPGTIRLG